MTRNRGEYIGRALLKAEAVRARREGQAEELDERRIRAKYAEFMAYLDRKRRGLLPAWEWVKLPCEPALGRLRGSR